VTDLSNQVIPTNGNASPITIDRLANGQPLVNGLNYKFLLSVVNTAGPSVPVMLNVIPMTVPGVPNITNVITGFGYADVFFRSPLETGGSEILYYTIYGEDEIIGYTSPIRILHLTNGSTYNISISATNAAGTGLSSVEYTFNMPLSAPGAPTITGLVPGNGYVDITLEPPVNSGGSPIITYIINPNPSTNYTITGNNLLFRVDDLTNGTSYTFSIRALNNMFQIGEPVVSESVIPYTVPDAPTITNVVASDSSVTITFDSPGWNGGSDILDYTVYYDGSSNTVIASSPALVSGLTNDVAYTFRMVARNAAGFSESSATFGPVTPKSEKTDYCIKQSCVKAQYSKLTTGGNDPKLTKAMRLSQVLNSRKPCNGFL
jgi:hypothetical protein